MTQSCPTLCNPRDRSMPGFPVHHQLPELDQSHVYQVGDAIQPSYLLSSPLLLPSIFPSIRVFSNKSALCIRCVDHKKLWEILKEMGIPDHLTCLLRNLYSGQEATVRTRHGVTDWFQIGKGVHQGCILSPCLFNVYGEYVMRNAGLEEAQAGIKIAGRNINNLRYADDTTLMAESEEELKSLLMKVKEESEKVGSKLNIQKMKIMASVPITNSIRLYFLGLQNHCR